MKMGELTPEFCKNKTFTCKKEIERLEIDLDRHMKCRIIGISPLEEDLVKVIVDTSDFVEHNNFYASSLYYDKNLIPCLTAREANYWPKDEKHTIYCMYDDVVEDYFDYE